MNQINAIIPKIATITANIGAKIDNIDSKTAVPVSATDTTGFAKPPVEAVEAKRVVAAEPLIVVAAPPPATIANAHVIAGLKSVKVDAITKVPATPANGTAKLSNTLST